MKKIVFLAISALLCVLAFVGCTKDATLEKNIVGEWETVNYRSYDSKDWYPVANRQVYVFETKTGGYIYTINEDMDEEDIERTKFTYTIEDERLTITTKEKYYDYYGDENYRTEKYVYEIQSLTVKRMIVKSSGGYKIELIKR